MTRTPLKQIENTMEPSTSSHQSFVEFPSTSSKEQVSIIFCYSNLVLVVYDSLKGLKVNRTQLKPNYYIFEHHRAPKWWRVNNH